MATQYQYQYQLTPLPPTADDCGKLVENIKHGTLYAYTAKKCRCDLCRANMSAYMHARHLAGKCKKEPSPRLPAEEARWRIRRLKDKGLGNLEIARLCGLSGNGVWNIEQGRVKTVLQSTVKALDSALRSGRRAPAGGVLVDGRKTRAIVNHMVKMLGRKGACKALDWCPSQLTNFLKRDTAMVRLATKEHVEKRALLLIKAAGLDRTHEGRTQIAKASGVVVNPHTEEDYERREWWRR